MVTVKGHDKAYFLLLKEFNFHKLYTFYSAVAFARYNSLKRR